MSDGNKPAFGGYVVMAAVLAAAGVLFSPLLLRAEDTSAEAPAARIDAVAYSEIDALRTKICLTNDTLAAMGCSQEQAATVLKALVDWRTEHKAGLDAVEAEKPAASLSLEPVAHVPLG